MKGWRKRSAMVILAAAMLGQFAAGGHGAHASIGAADSSLIALAACGVGPQHQEQQSQAGGLAYWAETPPLGEALSGITAISAGIMTDMAGYGNAFGSSYALHQDGTVYRWGLQRWEGSEKAPALPEPVSGIPSGIRKLEGNFLLTDSGEAWFLNPAGDSAYRIAAPSSVLDLAQVEQEGAALVLESGEVWRWWKHWEDGEERFAPYSQLQGIERVFSGPYRMFAAGEDGSLWELESYDPSAIDREPVLVALPEGQRAARVDAGFSYERTWIVTEMGERYLYRQQELTHAPEASLAEYVAVKGTEEEEYALRADGSLWQRSLIAGEAGEFVPVGGLPAIADIQVGPRHVLALTQDGMVYSWGSNMYGQLGLEEFYFGDFTRLGQVDQAEGIFPALNGVFVLRSGDIWRVTPKQTVEPVLLGKQAKSVATIWHGPAVLTGEGEVYLYSEHGGSCSRIITPEPVEQLAGGRGNTLLLLLASGDALTVSIGGQGETEEPKAKRLLFPSELEGGVKQLLAHPFPLVLTERGDVFYQELETDTTVRMKRIEGLPPIVQLGSQSDSYYEGSGLFAKAMDQDGHVYALSLQAPEEGSEEGKPRIAETSLETGGARYLSGTLVITEDGKAYETVYGKRYEHELGGLPCLEDISFIASRYSYYIEGPGWYRHALMLKDGSLWWGGYSPLTNKKSTPEQVRLRK